MSQESLGAHDLLIALNVAERINIVRETSTRTFLLYSYSLLRYRLLLISFGNLNSRELNSEDAGSTGECENHFFLRAKSQRPPRDFIPLPQQLLFPAKSLI